MAIDDDFEFHVVYTPGSVRYLSFLVWSLVDASEASFRLVSNGCDPVERAHLQTMSGQHPRLSYVELPVESVVPHGTVLDHLLAASRSRYFCFVDSDLFAVGGFLDALRDSIRTSAGVFTGVPVWVKQTERSLPEDFLYVNGSYCRTSAGLDLGVTYLAIYERALLEGITDRFGVGFGVYGWDDLSEPIRRRLRSVDRERRRYDTGKVVNLLLAAEGAALHTLDVPNVHHIGGISFEVGSERRRAGDRRHALVRAALRSPAGPAVRRLRRQRTMSAYRRQYATAPVSEFRLNATQRAMCRDPVRSHFLHVIRALVAGAPVPEPPPVDDPEVADRLASAHRHLVDVHDAHGHRVRFPTAEGRR